MHGLIAGVRIPESVWMTWGIMAALVVICLVLLRRIRVDRIGKLQSAFELFMENLCSLIREIVRSDPAPYVPLVGTLFIFVFVSNLVGMVPGLKSPTGDLGMAAGLAVVVFLSVPFYGLRAKGLRAYLGNYVKPNPIMLPFNLIGEFTRTLALAVRLFGNIMSGQFLMVVVIGVITTMLRGNFTEIFWAVGLLPTLFLSVLSLITAAIQAYIFTVLALVYIGSAVERRVIPEAPDAAQPQDGET